MWYLVDIMEKVLPEKHLVERSESVCNAQCYILCVLPLGLGLSLLVNFDLSNAAFPRMGSITLGWGLE